MICSEGPRETCQLNLRLICNAVTDVTKCLWITSTIELGSGRHRPISGLGGETAPEELHGSGVEKRRWK